jgi:hypothetical protein
VVPLLDAGTPSLLLGFVTVAFWLNVQLGVGISRLPCKLHTACLMCDPALFSC